MAEHEKSTDPINDSVYHLLKRAAQYAADLYMREAGHSGLTQRQFTVMRAVEQGTDKRASEQGRHMSQTELVRITGVDRSTLAEMISRLVAQGYLQRRRNSQDARTNIISLTEIGRKALHSASPSARNVDRQLLAAIPANRRKGFLQALNALADKAETTETEASAANPKSAQPKGS